MSTIKASNIQNGSSSSVNIALNTDGSATFAQMPVGPTSYLRNRIINGEMRTDQRNGGSSVTPASGAYTLDRWAVEMTQSSKFSVQQNAGGVTPPTGFTAYLGVTSLSAYSVISSDYFIISQGIEGVNIYDWAWGAAAATPVTLSFWVRSSVTGTYGGTFTNNGASRNYVFSYTINVANTWEYKTVTVPGDVTGTWVTNTTAAGVFVRFCFGAGASTQGAVGWTGSLLRTVTGQASVVGTNGATFYVTGVQVEVGSVATQFERRLYDQELAMCQRYYELVASSYQTTNMLSGGASILGVPFKTQKRTSPTCAVFTAPSLVNYSAFSIRTANVYHVEVQATNASSVTSNFWGAALVSASAEF